jgi:hypothetical protein
MTLPRFEVLFQPSSNATPTQLHTTADPNEATLAFHAELGRLRQCGEAGDVLVRKQNAVSQILFRHPVSNITAHDQYVRDARGAER